MKSAESTPVTKDDRNGQYLTLDLTDAAEAALSAYAGKIGKLLNTPVAQKNPDLAGALDDFLGSVYALIRAKNHSFTDRTGPIDIAAVEKRAQMIAAGKVRTDGKWVAGFYFNNALFRTAAVYHRILKIVTGKDAYVPSLRAEVQPLYPHWTCRNLDMVHRQVNELKHEPRGIHDERTVTYADALAAVGELLDLIDAWTVRKSVGPQGP